MKQLILKILTNKDARAKEKMNTLAASLAEIGQPWQPLMND